MGKRRYSDEEETFLMDYVPGHTYQEIADAFNEKFPEHYREMNTAMVNKFCTRHKITTGNAHRFQKGHVPANKGEKVPLENQSIGTQFQKGHTINNRPIGAEQIRKTGFVWVKVGQPRKWRKKHLVVWEQEHGRLPPGHVILSRDGNRLNCDLDNLALVTKSEHTYIIKTGIKWHDAETFDALLMMAKIRMVGIDKEKKS